MYVITTKVCYQQALVCKFQSFLFVANKQPLNAMLVFFSITKLLHFHSIAHLVYSLYTKVLNLLSYLVGTSSAFFHVRFKACYMLVILSQGFSNCLLPNRHKRTTNVILTYN